MKRLRIFSTVLIVTPLVLVATAVRADDAPQVRFNAYGSVNAKRQNIYRNVQDFTPTTRWTTDVEKLTLEPEIEFSPKLELETEIEFEHGGTGASMEFDGFEEFGEFESEVEQGGEVKLESFDLVYKAKSWFNIHGGLIAVPVGWQSQRDLPTQTFTVEANKTESHIIPDDWHDFGIGASGEIGMFNYQYRLVSSPNSEFFRKYNWIAGSTARRFERNFADSWSHVLRFDYGFARDERAVGFSIYYGNGTGARQKPGKLTSDSGLLITDFHAIYSWAGWKMRMLYLRGFLQNAAQVGQANSTLGGLASPGNYSSVGKQSEAAYIEVGYDLSRILPDVFSLPFDYFVRWDHWDATREAAANSVRDPRFRESSITTGINAYLYRHDVVAKLQYSRAQSGLDEIPIDHQIAIGLGFALFPKQGEAEDEIL